MPLIDKEILQLDLEVDASGAVRHIKNLDAAFSRTIRDISDQTGRLDKMSGAYFSDAIAGWGKIRKEMARVKEMPGVIARQMADLFDRVQKELRAQVKAMEDGDAEQAAIHAREAGRLRDQIELLKETRKRIDEIGQETINIQIKESAEALVRGIQNSAEFATALFQKDVPRAFGAGGKLAGRIIEKTFLGLGKKTSNFGRLLQSKGGALGSLGAAKGGRMGGAMEMAGTALKGLGGMLSRLGPMIQMLSSLGPILSVSAGALVSVVKLLVDAEAQAKQFQKDLLATASTGEFLANAGYNSNLAFSDLKDTVTDLRNAAFDWQTNLDWGLTSKDHLAFVNTLNQEGVSINRMAKEFALAKQQGQVTGDAVKYYAEQTATAVAISRNFGVQLNEIAQLQGTLMANLGMSLDSVQDHLASMTQAAAESGMAMNKFFAIIRGVSNDLSLYNIRVDTAIRMLSKLGRVMDPRTAQQFMTTITRGFKDMGRLDKLRLTLLAGQDNTKRLLDKDQQMKMRNLSIEMGKRIKGGEKEASKLLEAYVKGGKGAGRELSKALEGVEGGGAMREAASRMKMDRKAMQKGLFGLSQAIGDVGVDAQVGMLKGALTRFAPGAKKLSDVIGTIGGEMMAENMGISQEQLKQMAMFEEVMDETREDLVDQYVENGIEGRKVSEEEARRIVEQMSGEELLAKAGIKDAKELLKTEKDYAREQTKLTSSLLDKLQVVIDFLMNELYNVMTSIWEVAIDILSKLSFGDSIAKKKEELMIAKLRSPAVSEMYKKTGGDFVKMRGELAGGTVGKQLVTDLDQIAKKEEEIRKQVEREVKDGKIAADDTKKQIERQKELQKDDKELQKLYKTQEAAINALGTDPEAISRAVASSGVSNELAAAIQDQLYTTPVNEGASGAPGTPVATGKSFSEILDTLQAQGKISREELNKILAKSLWEGSQEGMLKLAATVSSMGGRTSEVLPPEAAPSASEPSAQRPDAVPGLPAAEKPPAAATTPPPFAEAAKDTAKATEDSLDLAEGQYATERDINDALRKMGIRLDKAYYKSTIGPIMENNIYEAISKALFEYWLYAGDPTQVKEFLSWAEGKGMTDLSSEQVRKYGQIRGEEILGNQKGGFVTGIRDGMAIIKPPVGEGLAAVGPGERIVPAGAGGERSSLAISVDVSSMQGPDFNRYLENAIKNAIYEYEARKRLT